MGGVSVALQPSCRWPQPRPSNAQSDLQAPPTLLRALQRNPGCDWVPPIVCRLHCLQHTPSCFA